MDKIQIAFVVCTKPWPTAKMFAVWTQTDAHGKDLSRVFFVSFFLFVFAFNCFLLYNFCGLFINII